MKKKFSLNMAVSGRVLACLNLLKKYKLSNKTIVDVGSSFGWLEKELLRLNNSIKMIGIEPDPEAVKFSNKNIKNAKFLVGDALKIPVKNGKADFVTLFDVIEHVPEFTELVALKEINRILKTKGLLFLTTPNSTPMMNILDLAFWFGHRHYQSKDLSEMLKQSGFKVVKKTIKGGYWFSTYLIWLYITKKLSGNFLPRNRFLEEKEASEFLSKKRGIHTHFIVAQKI